MRAFVVAVIVATAAAAHAEPPDPHDVAEHWLIAMRTHDTKLLAQITVLPLSIASGSINDGAMIGCDHHTVTTPKALFAMAGEGMSLFADGAQSAGNHVMGIFDCKRDQRVYRGRIVPVAALAGSHDVTFWVGSSEVTLRVSKSGQVVFVSAMHMSPGI